MVHKLVHPGVVELELKELTKEQLVDQVLRLQYMLEHRSDRELREQLARLETECDIQGSVLDRICELLHRFGYKTPDMPSIAKAIQNVLYKSGLVETILHFADGTTLMLRVESDSPLAESPNWSVHEGQI